MKLFRLVLALLLVIGVLCPTLPAQAAGDDARGLFDKLRRGESVTVAAIGGSITEAQTGWFSLVVDGLRTQFPNAQVLAVNAGVSGTGSDLGTFRLGRDVVAYNPDLVFIEFAVNDGDADEALQIRNLESLVVRLKNLRPAPAVVFVESASRFGTFRASHQKVARHYGLIDVDLQPLVDAELKAKNAAWETLIADDVHPFGSGHAFYAARVLEALRQADQKAKPDVNAKLPAPLSRMPLLLDGVVRPFGLGGPNWNRLPDGSVEIAAPGVLQIPFWGDAIGLLGVQAGAGGVAISVDGKTRSEPGSGWMYGWKAGEEPLENGWHVLTIAAPAAPDGKPANVRIGQLLSRSQENRPAPPEGWWQKAKAAGPWTPEALLAFRWQEIAPAAWRVRGPFGGTDAKPWLTPQRDLDKDFGVRFDEGSTPEWRAGEGSAIFNSGSWVDVAKMYGQSDRGVAYARLTLRSPREQTVRAALRFDYFGIVQVNGKEVLRLTRGHDWPGFRVQMMLPLRKGENQIWIKSHAGSRGHGFGLDVDAAAGLEVVNEVTQKEKHE